MIVVIPLILIGGVLGAAFMGAINIPGITPAKKKPAPKVEVAKKDEKPKKADPAPEKKTEVPKKAAPKPDPDKGFQAVADLWNKIDVEKLVAISEKWKDNELAQVMAKMKPGVVADFLGAMKPDRASKITKEIEKLAAAPKSDG